MLSKYKTIIGLWQYPTDGAHFNEVFFLIYISFFSFSSIFNSLDEVCLNALMLKIEQISCYQQFFFNIIIRTKNR